MYVTYTVGDCQLDPSVTPKDDDEAKQYTATVKSILAEKKIPWELVLNLDQVYRLRYRGHHHPPCIPRNCKGPYLKRGWV